MTLSGFQYKTKRSKVMVEMNLKECDAVSYTWFAQEGITRNLIQTLSLFTFSNKNLTHVNLYFQQSIYYGQSHFQTK